MNASPRSVSRRTFSCVAGRGTIQEWPPSTHQISRPTSSANSRPVAGGTSLSKRPHIGSTGMSPAAPTVSAAAVKSHAISMAATGRVWAKARAFSLMSGAAVAAMLVSRDRARSGRSVAKADRKSRAVPRSGTMGPSRRVKMPRRCFHDEVDTPSR